MENAIKPWYEFLIDIYGRTKAMTVLAEKIFLDYDDKSCIRDIEILIITSLYQSAAINLCHILDTDSRSMSIYQFRNAYYGKKTKHPKFIINNKALDRLRKRRNKLLAHTDQDANIEELPLHIDDLKSLLKSIEDELFPLAKAITGATAGRDCSTGEWFFQITRNVEVQYEKIKNIISVYEKMYFYMKENCKQELFAIIYGNEETNNGQISHGNP